MSAERNPVSRAIDYAKSKVRPLAAGATLASAAVFGGVACGGAEAGNNGQTGIDASATTSQATADPSREVTITAAIPLATVTPVRPTEVPATPTRKPIELKTILDQPITPVTIEQLREEALTAYDANPQAFIDGGSVYPRRNLERMLNYCETGNPNIPEVRIENNRLVECAGVVRQMMALYRQNGDSVLIQIVVDSRSYFVGQYPKLATQFDDFLTKAGVK